MALVIFCVALVEAMRTRMSFSEAILSSPRRSDPRSDRKPLFRHARPCAGHRRLEFIPRSETWMAGSKPGHNSIYLSKRLGVTLDHGLQLGGGVVAEVAAVADGVEDVDVLAAQQRQQTVLEGANLADRNAVEIAVDAGIDHHDLLFHLQRRELRLLQQFGEARAARQQALGRGIEIGAELRERRHFAVLR